MIYELNENTKILLIQRFFFYGHDKMVFFHYSDLENNKYLYFKEECDMNFDIKLKIYY
jgi:hypothetical protein